MFYLIWRCSRIQFESKFKISLIVFYVTCHEYNFDLKDKKISLSIFTNSLLLKEWCMFSWQTTAKSAK